jgi:hypothetical protein
MATKPEWKRGELENLKRKFPGMKWKMVKGEAIGRVGRLLIRASWTFSVWSDRFIVSLETREREQIALHVSTRHRDAIRRMQHTFRVLIGSLAEALPSSKRGV